MRTPRDPIRFLSAEETESIHRNALRILGQIGMRIDHDEALEYLAEAGCKVNFEARHVLFPEDIVDSRVEQMRQAFAARSGDQGTAVRYSHVRFGAEPLQIHENFTVSAGGYCVFVYDIDGVRRPATLNDTRDALRLAAQLDQITHTGLPVAAQDVPLPIRQIVMAAELVKHTDKLGGVEALDKFDIEYICRIGEVIRGGPEQLKANPVLVGYAEVKTPLTLDNDMCDVFVEYVKRGLPQSLDTMPNAGATAPIHPAAALTLGIAETLAGLVLAYSIDPEARVTVDVTPSFPDMRSGIFRYAGAERLSLLGARIQMISEYYGCPSGVHGGKTDSCVPDVRCGVEKALSMLVPVLCGAVGFGTIGHLENAVTFSPVQLVIDNEIVRYVRRAVRGFEVCDETINFDLIKRVGIGGNYLQEPDTASQFRDLLNLSPFFQALPWGSDPHTDEARRMEKRAAETARQLLRNEVPSPLSDDQIEQIDAIVAEADAKLREQGRL